MAHHVKCMNSEQGCVMFNCLVHLWEWLDPPVIITTSPSMESKKTAPATQQPLQQQHLMPHHVHQTNNHLHLHNHNQVPVSNLNSPQPYQIQPNGIVHQLLMQNPSSYQTNLQHINNSNPDARSPLLENQHDLYGTRQPIEYNRHYGANDNYPYTQKLDTRQEHVQPNHNINQDIMHAVPKGYNAEVYQDYMKRNPPKETNQIYQNHQGYQPNISQYTNKPYLPYTNRIQPPTQSNTELLRRQYNDIQQMKLQQQIHYQNQAQMQQQQTFAERQLLLQQMHGIQPPPNLQQSIYSDSGYKDSDRYNMLSQQSERDDRFKHQSPTEYQTQAQVKPSAPMSPMKSSAESTSPSVKSPTSTDSRRSSGGNQALRSPIAQRPASAPVTMSGLLYKQGSDGLKVWRKRWFVLAEYCLFYYKSQDEEKLLGSVLLPSYSVSACTAEDRVLRKYAFKLEHANMRTYVLAAPDQQSMVLWVKALTAAALMQDTRASDQQQKQTERKQVTNTENNEDDDEVPGPTYANAPPKPRRSNDGYNSPSPDIYDPNYDLLQKPASHYSQSNQSRYGEITHPKPTTNPEIGYIRTPQSPQYNDYYGTKRQNDQQNISLQLTNTTSEPINPNAVQYRNDSQPSPYDNRSRSYQQQKRQEEQTLNDERLTEQIYGRNQNKNLLYTKEKAQNEVDLNNYRKLEEKSEQKMPESQNYETNIYSRENLTEKAKTNRVPSTERLPIERRTPDAYGRSTVISYNRAKTSDYEDIYPSYSGENEYGMSYSKPTSPPSYAEKKSVPAMSEYQKNYSPTNYSSNQTQGFSGPSVLRRKKMQAASNPGPSIQRPHSADFLEYESKNELNKTMPARVVCEPAKQPQRPKSSLDINSYYDPSSDRYYSEESYSEKMRQSAQYLQQRGLSTKDFQVPLAKYTSGLAQKQLDSYTQNLNNNYESNYDPPKDTVSYNSKYSGSDLEALNSNWTLKEKALESQKEYLESKKDYLEGQKEYANRTGSAMSDGSNMSGFVRENVPRNDDSFMRSASARLPSTASEGKDGERKVQQREESMKRLLEWKQRMLQSPLTRKSTPASISLARSLNQSRQATHRPTDQYKPRTSNYTNQSYNSYSSDDEDQASDIEPHVKEMQAGRFQNNSSSRPRISLEHPPSLPQRNSNDTKAPDTPKSATECTYENISTKITHILDYNKSSNKDADLHENDRPENYELNAEKSTSNSNVQEEDPEITDNSEAESETQMEYTDNDLDEVLYQSDTELKSKREEKIVNEVYNKTSNKEENLEEDKAETPPLNYLEDHYLPMSPRKISSSLEPAHQDIIKHLSVFDKSKPPGVEDNPYVEMGLGNELEDEMQTYEIVCVNNGKVEPLYMELSNLTSGQENKEGAKSLTPTVFNDAVSNFADTKDLTLKRQSKEDKMKDESNRFYKGENFKHQRSDCSDADDEASKDISLSMPFNRFSISDNFRPASYYLRSSRNPLDLQDSSDSEIVSPPPIPTSTPPLEDVTDDLSKYVLDKLDRSNLSDDNSILKLLSYEETTKMNTVKRKTTSLMIYGSRPSIHDTLFRGEKIRHSRASLNDKSKESDSKNNSLLSNSLLHHYNSNISIETDSLMSYNADQGSSRMSLESDVSSKFDRASNVSSEIRSLNESDTGIEFRNSTMSQQDIDTMMKRRPLSDDSFFDIDSLESTHLNENIGNVDLDQYLDNLQNKTDSKLTRPLSDNSVHSLMIERCIQPLPVNDKIDALVQKTPLISHGRSASTPVGKSLVAGKAEMSANASGLYKGLEQRFKYNQGSTSSIGVTHTPISYYSKNYDEESSVNKNLNRAVSADKIKEFEGDKIALKCSPESTNSTNTMISHSRESSTEHSAPYYYSDLSSQERINIVNTSHYLKNTNVNRKLNNQRRRGPANKKNEISHIHNPIHNSIQPHFAPETPYELAAAARCVSVEFLCAADKNPEIDMKNIYESSPLKTPKVRDSMSSLHSNHSLKNASSLLDPNDISLPSSSSNFSASANATDTSSELRECNRDSSKSSENSSKTVFNQTEPDAATYDTLVCEGDMLWDEDALWRDNLRRASHRHARSMDDLDALPVETGRCSVDLNAMKNSVKKDNKGKKVTRNVTYVNSEIQNQVFGFVKKNDNADLLGGDIETKIDENDVYVSLACEKVLREKERDEGVYEQLTVESASDASTQNSLKDYTQKEKRKFEIDRENLRQWDLMSSGLMKNGGGGGVIGQGAGALSGTAELQSTDSGADSASNEASVSISGAGLGPNVVTNQPVLAKKSFLGSNTSIGRSNRDNNIPVRAVSPRVRWTEEKPSANYGSQQLSNSQQNLNTMNMVEDTWTTGRSPSRLSQHPIRAVSPRIRRHTDTDERAGLPDVSQTASKLRTTSVEQIMNDNLTAGELLGRTHEELVLLLIQLRRRHTATHQQMEQCAQQISHIKDCLSTLTALERQESLQRLEQLKHQLLELEQQYNKSKPLVHLVDNMVKLGSLYNRPAGSSAIDRLERNQRLRQKVLAEQAEEQRRWAEGKVGDPEAARARVEELWALERELAAEAATLHGLKADKEAIETLLTGVRSKFGDLHMSQEITPRGPQEALEADLARVHQMLAHNSKKLEQTVADNARLERELLSLRRALHTHRQTPATHAPSATPTTALLEDEVARVQQLVSALQRQRQELSRAVRHLTHQSRTLQTNQMPPEQPLYAPGSVTRQPLTTWLETDIDSGRCVEHGLNNLDYESMGHYDDPRSMQPLYVDTDGAVDAMSPLTSDDLAQNVPSNLTNVEKQEIKTVRIVKRESERRQRDRDRPGQPNDWQSSNMSVNLDHMLEEEFTPHYTNRSTSLPRAQYQDQNQYTQDYYTKSRNQPPNYLRLSNVNVPEINNMELSPKFPSSPSLSNYDYSRDYSSSYSQSYNYSTQGLTHSSQFLNSPTDSNRTLTNDPLSKTSSNMSLTRNAELSPIFKSEAAKQIITEMSSDVQPRTGSSLHRRQVPKEKRRHYTAPHHLSAKTLSEMPSEYFNQDKLGRSLDDADMERALRAPPDVVRSALAPQRYAENTIDQLLLAPRKIVIPERYIPEKPPELSPEEQKKRLEKVESIKKMLSSAPSSDANNKSPEGEEKRQRDHLLQMNQILAKQVMEMSKIVAVKALENTQLEDAYDSEDRSPDVELPIYQQRDNFFT